MIRTKACIVILLALSLYLASNHGLLSVSRLMSKSTCLTTKPPSLPMSYKHSSQAKASYSKKAELVDILSIDPTIALQIVYATPNNFTNQVIYDTARCLLHKPVALALKEIQQELKPRGLGLKIWDGYRPLSAQWKLWEVTPDKRYVADPRKGGYHTRGCAVDLTIIRLADGSELAMGSCFDDFSERAHHNYPKLTAQEQANRALLKDLMIAHGFEPYEHEWWHYNWKDIREYEPLDIPLTVNL